MSRPIGSAGLALIKKFEGCRLGAYQDAAGVWTIGYGHTAGTEEGMTITQDQAEEYLREDCQRFADAVDALGRNFDDNQRDALISFAFNLGEDNLKKVTVNNRSCEDIAKAMPLYCNACGKKLQGLVDRRNEEVNLFNTPCASIAVAEVSEHAHGIGEDVTYSSYYDSAYDTTDKAKFCNPWRHGPITAIKNDVGVKQPYLIDGGRCWVNDGDIRFIGETPEEEQHTLYVVQSGDTLSKIARQNNTTVNDLVSLNGIENPNAINVGQQVKIN